MSIEVERYEPEPSGGGPSGPRGGMRGLAVFAFVVALFVIAYLGVKWLASSVNDIIASPTTTTVVPGQDVEFEILAGTPASQIARDLAAKGVVTSSADFDKAVRDAKASDRLQAGTYQLQTGMDPVDVLALLVAGPTRTTYRMTIVEGLTAGKMLDSISRQTGITLDDLTTPLLDGTITSGLMPHAPEQIQDWEGLLFPDTYEFRIDATAVDVLTKMARTAEVRVGAIDWTYLTDRDLTPYDGIIIASLVEREALFDEDRSTIASVIYNRLAADMALQLDVSVVYVLGGMPSGGLSSDDLQIDSPYNTYVNKGLPPTPIAGVRTASLEAAANPAVTDYLYFLTDSDGHAHFAVTFDEFLALQQEYLGSP